MPKEWSGKRERQYEHIKDSVKARGKGEKLADVMSGNVRCAKEDDDIDQVLIERAEAQIRRLPGVDGNQKLVGIVTLGDIAAKNPEDEVDVAMSLGDISSPAEPDRPEGGQSQSQSQG